MFKYFNELQRESAQHINGRASACLMTYDVCEVTCRETTTGHLWVFGGVSPLRCVLGNPGWRVERDSYLPKGSDAFRASKATFEQNKTAQRPNLAAQLVKN